MDSVSNNSSEITSSPSQLAYELEEVFEEEPRIISCVLVFTFIYILCLITLVFVLVYLIVEVNEYSENLLLLQEYQDNSRDILDLLKKTYRLVQDGRV